MRLRRYVSLEKSISIVSLGGTCRVLRAHGTAASSLAGDCFAVLSGSATMPLRRYVSLEKSISIVSFGGTCRFLRAHDSAASSLADTASRFSVAPPPCVFGALSCSIVDSNRHGRRDLSCSSCSRHRCFIGGTGSLALPGGFAAISVVPSTAYRERVDPRRGCSASARCGLLLWQSFFESSNSGRSRGTPSSPAGRSESL